MKKVTIKEIAKVCGVSVATVSYVLNGKTSEIGDETVKKVLATAKELNYSKNQVARSLVTQKSKTLAIIVPDISNRFYSTIVKSVIDEASKNEYSILLSDADNDANEEIKQLSLLDNRLIDGILLASRNSAVLLDQYENNRNLPIVILDEESHIEDKNIFAVATDNEEAAYTMTKKLIEDGHRNFCCLTGFEGSTNSQKRKQGVLRAFEEYKIDLAQQSFYSANYNAEKAYQAVQNISEIDFTALICFNDLMAYGAIKALKEKKLKIPENVSVVGFDTNTSQNLVTDISDYRLTSINQDEELIGKVSTNILIETINGKTNFPKMNLLPWSWHEGTTTKKI